MHLPFHYFLNAFLYLKKLAEKHAFFLKGNKIPTKVSFAENLSRNTIICIVIFFQRGHS